MESGKERTVKRRSLRNMTLINFKAMTLINSSPGTFLILRSLIHTHPRSRSNNTWDTDPRTCSQQDGTKHVMYQKSYNLEAFAKRL